MIRGPSTLWSQNLVIEEDQKPFELEAFGTLGTSKLDDNTSSQYYDLVSPVVWPHNPEKIIYVPHVGNKIRIESPQHLNQGKKIIFIALYTN